VWLGQDIRRKSINDFEGDYSRENSRTSRSSKNLDNITILIHKIKIHVQDVPICRLRSLHEKPQTLTCGESFLKSSQIIC